MRQLWLDYARAFACVLVTLGHLLMSFLDAQILHDSWLLSFCVQFIYYFHVYIFFFCGGYLFQKSTAKLNTAAEHIGYKLLRCVDFLIPYVLFSAVTYGIRVFLSADVNSQITQSLGYVLLVQPVGHMWYLYAVAVITVLFPPIRSKTWLAVVCAVAIVLKLVTWLPGYQEITPLHYLCRDSVWFALGMVWAYTRVQLKGWMAATSALAFVGLGVFHSLYPQGRESAMLLTFLGVVGSVELIRVMVRNKTKLSGVWKYLSRYMLQIYLLHTICAAGIRIVLFRLGVTHWAIHLPAGLVFSFGVPILCAMLAQRIRFLNIVFFPSKTIRELRAKNIQVHHM